MTVTVRLPVSETIERFQRDAALAYHYKMVSGFIRMHALMNPVGQVDWAKLGRKPAPGEYRTTFVKIE